MAAYLSNIANLTPKSIDEEKLKVLCAKHNVWDYFGVSRDEFGSKSESEQVMLLKKFYYELEPTIFNVPAHSNIDNSISKSIENSSNLTMAKIIENEAGNRSEVTVSSSKNNEKKKLVNLWPELGYFKHVSCDFSIEKTNLPENTIFYIN